MQEVQNNQVGPGRAASEDTLTAVGEFPELNGSAGSDRELMVAPELAVILRMTPAWVYAQARANKIPHVPLGRYVRFRRATIDAWLSDIEHGRIQAPW